MKKLTPLVKTILRLFLILSIAGLAVDFFFILWSWFSHYFNWEGFILKYYNQIDFNKIWTYDKTAFSVILLFEFGLTILKINLILKSLKLLKRIDTELNFNEKVVENFRKITVFAFLIGLISIVLKLYIEISVSNDLILSTQIGNASYIWLSAIFFIMTLVYEKGISLQSENDLTI